MEQEHLLINQVLKVSFWSIIRQECPGQNKGPWHSVTGIIRIVVAQIPNSEQEISASYNLYCETYNLSLQKLIIVSGPLFLRLIRHNFKLV